MKQGRSTVPITGIAEIIYGVEDFDTCVEFFEDYGLSRLESGSDHALFSVISGQQIRVYPLGDDRVPKSELMGPGVQECIWAVPRQQDLDGLVADLSRDHEVTIDETGTAHFVTSFGQAIGLRVFQPLPYTCCPAPTNAPGIINRMNVPRKWLSRAIPKTISHCVWTFLDVNEAFDFYSQRLGFRMSDIQKGVGIYIRAGRSTNHHNIMLADADQVLFGFDGKFRFHHVNFGVEDLDEIMAGKNYMTRKGYGDNGWGFGRHRVSSELFLYMPSPAGGEVEYGADCDQVDGNWRPRVWGAAFAAFTFIHDMPDWLKEHEPEWDVSYVTPETARYVPIK
ncbi:VOC family protein, partial [Emcibacter nanhaiensis]